MLVGLGFLLGMMNMEPDSGDGCTTPNIPKTTEYTLYRGEFYVETKLYIHIYILKTPPKTDADTYMNWRWDLDTGRCLANWAGKPVHLGPRAGGPRRPQS